jgi:hypothetical protein
MWAAAAAGSFSGVGGLLMCTLLRGSVCCWQWLLKPGTACYSCLAGELIFMNGTWPEVTCVPTESEWIKRYASPYLISHLSVTERGPWDAKRGRSHQVEGSKLSEQPCVFCLLGFCLFIAVLVNKRNILHILVKCFTNELHSLQRRAL